MSIVLNGIIFEHSNDSLTEKQIESNIEHHSEVMELSHLGLDEVNDALREAASVMKRHLCLFGRFRMEFLANCM